jgi:hypothetical protein
MGSLDDDPDPDFAGQGDAGLCRRLGVAIRSAGGKGKDSDQKQAGHRKAFQ